MQRCITRKIPPVKTPVPLKALYTFAYAVPSEYGDNINTKKGVKAMRDITDKELAEITEELIERACAILSDAAYITDELTSILASISNFEECAQIDAILSESDIETSLKPI